MLQKINCQCKKCKTRGNITCFLKEEGWKLGCVCCLFSFSVSCYPASCFWTLDVIPATPYKIPLVRLSVRPSLSFLKIESLVFSDIVHYTCWPWYLVTDKAKFLKKKLVARIWGRRPKSGSKRVFSPFYWVFS